MTTIPVKRSLEKIKKQITIEDKYTQCTAEVPFYVIKDLLRKNYPKLPKDVHIQINLKENCVELSWREEQNQSSFGALLPKWINDN
jgi:hypothetical protein